MSHRIAFSGIGCRSNVSFARILVSMVTDTLPERSNCPRKPTDAGPHALKLMIKRK